MNGSIGGGTNFAAKVLDMAASNNSVYLLSSDGSQLTAARYVENGTVLESSQSTTFSETTGNFGVADGKVVVALPSGVKVLDADSFTETTDPVPTTTSPKDAAIAGRTLYVLDENKLVTFDMDTKISTTFDTGETVDSVAVANGTVYYTASGANPGLFKLVPPGISPTLEGDVAMRPLRPANDYQARIFLNDAQGRLVGSLEQADVALKPGGNVLDLTVTENTEALRAGVQSGSTLTWDGISAMTATVLTGFANNVPGVAKVEVTLSGECYNQAGGARLVTLTDATTWKTYAWNLNAATGTYLPANLVRGKSGTLTVKAYDRHGTVVGTTTIAIQIDFPTPVSDGPGGPGGPGVP